EERGKAAGMAEKPGIVGGRRYVLFSHRFPDYMCQDGPTGETVATIEVLGGL
ncbi:MAG: hypothetical protein JWO19_880, partial [Bryobacterales bacterium]|nr:hypothetical protein [Bryobacterales bacterium]